MTTEQKLREAIGALTCRVGRDHAGCWCLHAPGADGADEGHDEGCLAARAALALPPSETREEWRVAYEGRRDGGWAGYERRGIDRHECIETAADLTEMNSSARRNIRIESRTVCTSPWAEVTAGIPPSPQAECADLIGQCMDKLIDAAPFQTICAFQGSKDAPCQKCGKSWMAPDHQAPLFDPRTPR